MLPPTPVELPIAAYVYLALWLFFSYSFAGVIVETVFTFVKNRGLLESRAGLLYLPFNLLYGTGGLVITLALLPFVQNPFAVFGVGFVVGSVLEYLTSLVIEKAFGVVYWDYSKEFLNIHGRICLKYAIFWGLLSLVLLYVLTGINLRIIVAIPGAIGVPVLTVLVIATIASGILTLLSYQRLGQRNAVLRARTEGGDAVLPQPAWGRLVDRLVPDRVLFGTFPEMSLVTEHLELTGGTPRVLQWTGRIGRPSDVRVAAGERRDQRSAA
jgi:uncharacterized membrane protein